MFGRLFAFVDKYPKRIVQVILVLVVALVIWLAVGTSIGTRESDLFYDKYIAAFDFATQEMNDPVATHVTVEGRDGANTLSVELMREQDKLFHEIEEKWPVRVESITSALNRRINTETPEGGKQYYVRELNLQSTVNNLIYDMWRDDPYEFERFARKGLSNQGAIDALAELSLLNSFTGGLYSAGDFDLPLVSAVRATVTPREHMDDVPRLAMLGEIRDFARAYSDKITVRMYSGALVVNEADHRVRTNSVLVTGLMALLLAVVLWFTFRDKFFVWMPLAVLGSMLVFTYGVGTLTWSPTLTILAVVPIPLLLGQTIDNLIHFSERFREEIGQGAGHSGKKSKREALRTVFNTAGRAAALTTLINMSAFTADAIMTNLRPIREYTYLVVLGIGFAFILTYLLGGALLLLRGRGRSAGDISTNQQGLLTGSIGAKKHDRQQTAASREYHWGKFIYWKIRRFRVLIMVAALLILAGAIFMLTKIDRNHDPTTYMAKSFPVYDAYNFEKANFSVYEPHYILIRGDATSEKAIQAVTELEAKLGTFEDVEHIQKKVNTESLRYLKSRFIEESVPETQKDFFADIKESDAVVNHVLLTPAKELFGRIVHQKSESADGAEAEYDATIIKFWPKLSDSKRLTEIYRELQTIGDSFAPDLQIEISGEFLALSLSLRDSMNSAAYAAGVTALLIIIVLSIVYRSAKTGLITAVPIFFDSMIGMGILPVLGIAVTPLNATVAVVAVGLGIDYSIQVMTRYREEIRKSVGSGTGAVASYDQRERAMAESFGHMVFSLGKAMLLTCAGLFVLILLLPLTGMFGIAASIAIFTSYLAALLVMPTLAVRYVRK